MPEISAFRAIWHRPDRTKTCILCQKEKVLGEFYCYDYRTKQGKQGKRYESRCRDCAKARRKNRYAAVGDCERAYHRQWNMKNAEHVIAYRKRRQSDPAHRQVKALHQRLRKARCRAQAGDEPAIRSIYKEAMKIEQVVAACPVFDLKELGKKMHVDHIIPLSRGGLHEAKNLQILPSGLNIRKGALCQR